MKIKLTIPSANERAQSPTPVEITLKPKEAIKIMHALAAPPTHNKKQSNNNELDKLAENFLKSLKDNPWHL